MSSRTHHSSQEPGEPTSDSNKPDGEPSLSQRSNPTLTQSLPKDGRVFPTLEISPPLLGGTPGAGQRTTDLNTPLVIAIDYLNTGTAMGENETGSLPSRPGWSVMTGDPQHYGQEDSPAKTSVLQVSEPDSLESGASSPSPSLTLWPDISQPGFSWKMYRDSSPPTQVETLGLSSVKWANSGTGGPTGYWMHAISESPNVVVESTLSEVLEPTAPLRFYLTARAAEGILRRANRRGRSLPTALRMVLERQVSLLKLSTPNGGVEPQDQAGTNSTTSLLTPLDHSLQEPNMQESSQADEKQWLDMSSSQLVRRITPLEAERLMGWPDGHTIARTWKARRTSASPGELKLAKMLKLGSQTKNSTP